MDKKQILNLNFDHLFIEDGSEDYDFGFKSSADNINMNSTSPLNDLMSYSLPATPMEVKKIDFSTSLKLQTNNLEKDVSWVESCRLPTSKGSGTTIDNYEKSDLNMKVDELVNGFKNNQIQGIEEGKEAPRLSIRTSRVFLHSEPIEIHSSQLFKSAGCHPVKASRICNGKMVSTNTTEEFHSEISETFDKPKRWGKDEDKIMFVHLKRLLGYYGVQLEELTLPESMNNPTHYKMLLTLKRDMGWVGTTRQILKRVWILKENASLSVRDKRLLRKLVNQQVANRSPNLDNLIYEFPCKSKEEIIKIANRIFQRNLKISF